MKLLHIDSSALGGASVSRQLTAQVVAQWKATHPDAQVDYLDLVADAPVPPERRLARFPHACPARN
jgi:FMN-dependent NADH-azoreductase